MIRQEITILRQIHASNDTRIVPNATNTEKGLTCMAARSRNFAEKTCNISWVTKLLT